MSYDDPVITPGWPLFFVIWSRVFVALSILIILFWVLGYLSHVSNDGGEIEEEMTRSMPAPTHESNVSVVTKPQPKVAKNTKNTETKNAGSTEYEVISSLGALRVYFDIGSDVVPIKAIHDLRPMIDYLIKNKNTIAVISGYHDASGDIDINKKISKKRAIAVRDFLITEGVDIHRLVLKQPQQSHGTGVPDEARRVEIAVSTPK